MLACEKGYPKTVAALLNIRHTDVNLMTSSGATAYGIAELKNDKETKLFFSFPFEHTLFWTEQVDEPLF